MPPEDGERTEPHADAIGQHAGRIGNGLDLFIDLIDGINVRIAPVTPAAHGGDAGLDGRQHFVFVREHGGIHEHAGLGLLQENRVGVAGRVAFGIVNGDFERLRFAVVCRIRRIELHPLGGTANGAGGLKHLVHVFVVELFEVPDGGRHNDTGREELGQGASAVLHQTLREIREDRIG